MLKQLHVASRSSSRNPRPARATVVTSGSRRPPHPHPTTIGPDRRGHSLERDLGERRPVLVAPALAAAAPTTHGRSGAQGSSVFIPTSIRSAWSAVMAVRETNNKVAEGSSGSRVRRPLARSLGLRRKGRKAVGTDAGVFASLALRARSDPPRRWRPARRRPRHGAARDAARRS